MPKIPPIPKKKLIPPGLTSTVCPGGIVVNDKNAISKPYPKPKVNLEPALKYLKKPQDYRCEKCHALHGYLAVKCQTCGHKKLVEVPANECKACRGTGKSSRGTRCFPCDGTGRRK